MRRPFLGVVSGYALGVCLGEWFEPPLGLLFAAVVSLLTLFCVVPRARPLLLVAIVVWAGWLNRVRQGAILSSADLRHLLGGRPVLAEVCGVLVRSPELRRSDSPRGSGWRSRVLVEVEVVRMGGRWQPAVGRVWAQVPDRLGEGFYRGRRVVVMGVLKRPAPAVAPGLFDRRAQLRRQGVYFVMSTESTEDWRVAEAATGDGRPWSDRFLAWARSVLATGLPDGDSALRLRWAMLLGLRGGLTAEMREPFVRAGSMHVFAISGLHVTLVAGILVAACRFVRLPRSGSGAIVIPALWFYAGATGWQPSAVRATVMMSVIVAGWALRRPSDLLNSLAGAAWLILLWDPQQLFQAGFQVSFGVVLSLAVLLPILLRWRDRWLGVEAWLPRGRGAKVTIWCRAAVRRLTDFLAVSLAAWIGSLPWIAWYFQLVTPVSVLANILVVPLSGVVVLSGLCSLACGTWWTWGCECFNHAGWAAMHCLREISLQAAELPGAWYAVARPSPVFLVGYVGLLLWPLSRQGPRSWRTGWALMAVVLVIVGWVAPRWQARDSVEVVVLPVGGGDSLWADLPGEAGDLLIDTGDAEAVEWVVGPWLRARGRRDIPRLLLSHGDTRHVSGVPELLQGFTVGRCWIGPQKSRSAVYRRVLELLATRDLPCETMFRGVDHSPLRVLHPAPDDTFSRADDQAVVLLLEWEGGRVLLCSDLGRFGQDRLIEREPSLRVDVLVAGMPGSEDPLKEPLLEVLQPKAIVVSTGRYPSNQQPSRALRLRLARLGVPVLYTDDVGAVTVHLRGAGVKIAAMDGTSVWLPGRSDAGPSD